MGGGIHFIAPQQGFLKLLLGLLNIIFIIMSIRLVVIVVVVVVEVVVEFHRGVRLVPFPLPILLVLRLSLPFGPPGPCSLDSLSGG